jgi:hypothetical protein
MEKAKYTLVIWNAREKPNSHAMALEKNLLAQSSF